MGLLTKDKINQFGISEEYWRILKIDINLQYNYCDITLGGYKDKDLRDEGVEPMNIKKVRAKWDDEEFYKFFAPKVMARANTNIYAQAYEYIKSKDEYFVNALDS